MLSKRLQAVWALVPPGHPVADIGTDHGFLALELSRICPRVIATDLNKGPYAAACRHIQSQGVKNIEVRWGRGLEPLRPGEVETVVLAGMGGNTMLEILAEGDLSQIKHLILQPQSFAPELRIWLNEHGWYLQQEKLVLEEGHLYVIMAAVRGRETQKFFRRWGPRLWENQDPLWPEYLERLNRECQQVLAGIAQSQHPLKTELAVRAELYGRLQQKIQQIKKEMNQC